MRRHPMTALLLLCWAASLSACADHPLVEKIVALPPLEIPAVYLQPCPKPPAPGPDATQRDVAALLVDQDEALDNCNADKAAIAAIVRKEHEPK